MDTYAAIWFFYVCIGIGVSCIFGAITKSINENKGYDGGFAWGFWLGWIGIIVVACRQPAQVYYPPSPGPSYNNSSSNTPGGWRCTCGRFHSAYVTSCTCGQSKRDALNPRPVTPVRQPAIPATPAPAPAPAPTTADETKTIAALKEYKDLLDSGIITQEEFEQKKKTLLSR